mgnify:CR=1 FL=1
MNNPIQTMFDEHEIISNACDFIENINGLWESSPLEYSKKVNQLLLFFKEYSDGFHHHKEEVVLFPALKKCVDFTLTELLDELEMHHEDFREYTNEVEEYIKEKKFESSYRVLQTYSSDLLDHIGAENDELFVLAESLLDDSELETIYYKFKDIDIELGVDKKEELESIIV